MYQNILKSIWDDPATRNLYVTALEITEEARYPETYDAYKETWHDATHKQALKLLLKRGFHEPMVLV